MGAAIYLTSQAGCMLLSHIQQLPLLLEESFATSLLDRVDALPPLD